MRCFVMASILLLSSCQVLEGIQKNQAIRYIEKNGSIVRTDTTHDTVYVNIPGAKSDTVFRTTPGKRDTFKMVLDNRVFTTVYKSRKGDSIRINQKLVDQKAKAVNTTVEREILTAAKSNATFIRFVIVALLVCAFLLALAKVASSFRKQ